MMDDYRGPFDPAFRIDRLSRQALAVLCREYMLAGHMIDRIGLPLVMARGGAATMREVAIDEWMGASPVYTKRVQRAFGFTGDDVATIFKGIQLDVGAPHHFLDFQFAVHDAQHGEFWLDHCGALIDVEPMGEEHVRGMCHQIEDPTFDATAVATNPRARVRPIHRPPRVPADRVPHCRWTVTIDPAADPVPTPRLTERVRGSRAAAVVLPTPTEGEPGGWPDYAGPFDTGFQFEDLGHAPLVVAAQELCLQAHLLARALLIAVAERWDDAAARDVGRGQWVGVAGWASERVAAAMQVEGSGPETIAKVLQLHPSFRPRAYVDFHVELDGDVVRCWVGECDALREGDPYSWFAQLGPDPHPALAAMVRAVNARARCRPTTRPGARFAWEIAIDASAEPVPEPPEVGLLKISTGASWVFRQRRPVRR